MTFKAAARGVMSLRHSHRYRFFNLSFYSVVLPLWYKRAVLAHPSLSLCHGGDAYGEGKKTTVAVFMR